MEKEQLSLWTSDETYLFCEILANLMNNFKDTLKNRALKNYLHMKYLIPLLFNLKNAWKMLRSKKKIQKTLKQEERNQIVGRSETNNLKQQW